MENFYDRKYWSQDARKAFALFAAITWPFGLWPLVPVNFFLTFRVLLGIGLVFGTVAIPFREMCVRCGTAEDMIDDLIVVATGVLALSKLICYHVYRDRLQPSVVSAIEDWSSQESKEFKNIMTSQERTYKSVAFALISTAAASTFLYSVKIFFTEPDRWIEAKETDGDVTSFNDTGNGTRMVLRKRFLFPSTCTLNDVPPLVYPSVIFIQYMQVLATCTVNTGSDAFFIAVTSHLCGQLEILKTKFCTVGEENNPTESRIKLNSLIGRHVHLLELAAGLEDAYNIIVFTQLLVSVTLITVFGFSFLMTLEEDNYVGAIKNVVVIQFMLLQTFMYSYVGENLQCQGDDIITSLYGSSWYELPNHLSKNLIFVMMRSNVPLQLSAGKFFSMTHATFMDVLKTSASYLSVLRIMIQE
ncbi:putative odorant receptor 71a [Venturia canescens]|uniref:putative odorant receptor 71a n=1 Tax=Venturia canescens TaxID=32260 RepID=UPI001C9C9241|nr:putative odorant receptor 71a [Venturia canescens]